MFKLLFLALTVANVSAFAPSPRMCVRSGVKARSSTIQNVVLAAKKDDKEELAGMERLQNALKEADELGDKREPPIYNPGPYTMQALAALAYFVPIVDAADLGKYLFEAYPSIGSAYSTVFGPASAIYNGVPFLPFAIFFLLSYICRAPTFPTEVRFHVAQAFMLSLIQFVPSVLFGFAEKAGVPGMGVAYNTVFLWVMVSAITMQTTLLNPISESKNPFLVNIVGWSMRYMGYAGK
jgi:hypothetical protein